MTNNIPESMKFSSSVYVTENRSYVRYYLDLYKAPLNIVFYVDDETQQVTKNPQDFEKFLQQKPKLAADKINRTALAAATTTGDDTATLKSILLSWKNNELSFEEAVAQGKRITITQKLPSDIDGVRYDGNEDNAPSALFWLVSSNQVTLDEYNQFFEAIQADSKS